MKVVEESIKKKKEQEKEEGNEVKEETILLFFQDLEKMEKKMVKSFLSVLASQKKRGDFKIKWILAFNVYSESVVSSYVPRSLLSYFSFHTLTFVSSSLSVQSFQSVNISIFLFFLFINFFFFFIFLFFYFFYFLFIFFISIFYFIFLFFIWLR